MRLELAELKHLIQNKNWNKASKFIQQYEENSSSEIYPLKYYILKGKCLTHKNLGLEWWEQGLKSFPRNIQLNKNYIRALIKKHSFGKAFKAIERAITFHPNDSSFLIHEIELFIKLDEREKALESSIKYNQQFNADSYGIFLEIRSLLLLKRREEANQLFEKNKLDLDPRHLLEIHLILNQYISVEKICNAQIDKGEDLIFWECKKLHAQILSNQSTPEIKVKLEGLIAKILDDVHSSALIMPIVRLDAETEKSIFQFADTNKIQLGRPILKYKKSVDALHAHEREIEYSPLTEKKVDLVYTWVDMKDPKFLEKFEMTNGFYPKSDSNFQQSKIRYTDHGEIKFSLLTVQKYFSHVNHIYIVTNDQEFDLNFLDEDFKSKITFINQEDIIPKELVPNPTFNSNLIETFIWNIPNLSETFLYFCDDYFLGNYLKLDRHVFDEDNIPFSLVAPFNGLNHDFDEALLKFANEKTKYRAFNHNAYTLYKKVIGEPPIVIDLHLPMLLRKKACKEAFQQFSPFWEEDFFKNSLRKNSCYYTLLMYNWYSLEKGYQKLGPYHEYKKNALIFNNGLSQENFKILMQKRPLFFCINFLPDHESQNVFQNLSDWYLSNG